MADINGDGIVNFEDFAILADQWFQLPGSSSEDITPSPGGDGAVDMLDFAVLVDNWLAGL